MKKYVVGYEEQCLFICNTRADAEELILAFVEEDLYYDWLLCNDWDKNYVTPLGHIARINGDSWWKWNISLYAYALLVFSQGYWIDEIEEI